MQQTKPHKRYMAKHSTAKKSASGAIRIISGKHRGRKLPVLDAQGLRPTTDRVKETLFNWLMPYIQQSDCLDCFAGAGSLAFEAHSRGASSVTLCELDKGASRQLKSNIALLKATNMTVHQTDALAFLQQNATPMDIVFIDPPFRQGLATKAAQLVDSHWLKKDSLIYLEVESELALDQLPSSWQLLKEKVAGQVAYRLFQKG